MNYQLAVRQSLVNKLGIYLQQDGSRDMSIPLNFSEGRADFQFGDTTYGIVPIKGGQNLFYPGINVLFLGESDAATGRTASMKKRYLLPVKILIVKEISGNTRPQIVEAEVLGVTKLVIAALSDGRVDIWNYEAESEFSGITGWYHDVPYGIADESLSIPGGDVRKAITIFVNYADPS